jgi:hypothetical protein
VILLDTNVASEFSKRSPNMRVARWLEAHDRSTVFLSAVSVAEMRAGIAVLADGKRKAALTAFTDATIAELGACVPFDGLAADAYANIIAARRAMGRPIGVLDAQIAAIAVSGGFVLATLNTKDFDGIDGLTVVDPSA